MIGGWLVGEATSSTNGRVNSSLSRARSELSRVSVSHARTSPQSPAHACRGDPLDWANCRPFFPHQMPENQLLERNPSLRQGQEVCGGAEGLEGSRSETAAPKDAINYRRLCAQVVALWCASIRVGARTSRSLISVGFPDGLSKYENSREAAVGVSLPPTSRGWGGGGGGWGGGVWG